MKYLAKVLKFITLRRRLQLIALSGLIFLSSSFELISLGAVIPFLVAITSPEKVFHHDAAQPLINMLQIRNPEQLVFPIVVLFIFASIFSAAIKIFLIWFGARLTYRIGADISLDMYSRTLHQPYTVHISRNSSEVIGGITAKTSAVISGGLMPAFQLISALLTLFMITFGLIIINPLIAFTIFLSFGLIYGSLSFFTRKKLSQNGQKIATEYTKVLKCLQEGLGGIRDILLRHCQLIYCRNYRDADLLVRQSQANSHFISSSPRYIMEALGLSMMAYFAYYLTQESAGLEVALPILGLIALAAQRMLPALQQAYGSWAVIRTNEASIQDALALLEQPMPYEFKDNDQSIVFRNEIKFNSVTFSYPLSHTPILTNVNLKIRKGEKIGIIGKTGCGKTTLVDLLMALLDPTDGYIDVDGTVIDSSTRRAWQSHIAHVSQTIYLSDSTVAENIAFGLPVKEIDQHRVQAAARQAIIDDFIMSLPRGYQSIVGERGIALSGGQRQRIGIARALYNRADVIIFDEATSALDNSTEDLVMDSIDKICQDLTVVIIAHRLSTLKKCDRIIELKNGFIERTGSYIYMTSVTSSDVD